MAPALSKDKPSSPPPTSNAISNLIFRRIPNNATLTRDKVKKTKRLSGTVVKVGDADGFRLYHQPGGRWLGPLLHPIPNHKLKLGEETISIRLAGADAPELPHFGKPGQPYGPEALEALEKMVLNKRVTVDVGRVDQYKRLVGTPYVWRAPYLLGPTNVSLTMVRKGLATVYTQGGAEYGHESYWDLLTNEQSSGKDKLVAAQQRAQAAKRGMWSQAHITTPAEFKKANRNK